MLEPRALTHLAAMGRDDAKVSWNPVPTLDLHQVADHHLLGIHLHLLAFPDHKGLLGVRQMSALELPLLGVPGHSPPGHVLLSPCWALLTWGTMFLKDSMILELLASW